MTEAAAPPTTPQTSEPPKRSRWVWRVLLWLCAIAVVLGVAGVGLAMTLPGNSYQAPAWVESRVEARLQQMLPQHEVRVSRMRVAFENDLRPRIGLQDIELSDRQGLTRLTLGDIDLGLSLTAAAQGQVQARDLHISGVVVSVARARDGTLDFSFGQSGTTRAQFADLPQAIAALTQALDDPRLTRMERVALDGLTIRFADARAGRNWTVDGGLASIERDGRAVALQGSFAVLGGRSVAATLEAQVTADLDAGSATFALNVADFAAADLAAQSPALAWLDVVRTSLSGTLAGELAQGGDLKPLRASLDLGAGALQPTEATEALPFDTARTRFVYDPTTGQLRFEAVEFDSNWLSVAGQGQVLMGEIANGLPQAYTGQFQFDRIAGTMGGVYDSAQDFGAADVDLRVALDPFELHLGQALIHGADPDGAAQPITARGRAAAGPDGWVYGVEAFAEALPAARVKALWPPSLNPKTRDWVAENVIRADLHNVQFALRNAEDGPEGKPGRDMYVGFAFDKAETRVMKTLPPIQDAAGQFTLYQDRLTIEARRGYVDAPQGGRLSLAGAEFVMPNVKQRPNPAEVTLAGSGPVAAVLSLIDQPPFEVLKKAKQPVTLAKSGQGQFEGTIALTLGPKEQRRPARYAFTGTARDVVSDVLVKGRTLRASALDVAVDNANLRISGTGSLSGVPFDGVWAQPLGQKGAQSKITAKVRLSDENLRAFGVTLPKGMVSGQGPGDLVVELGGGKRPSYRIASTLAGLGLRIDPISWRLGAKQTGKLEVTGQLGETPTVDRLSLDAPGLRATGAIELAPGGGFKTARFDRVRAGGWLDGAVTLTSRGKNATPAIRVDGARIDMRSAPFGKGGAQTGGGRAGGAAPINIAVRELVVTDGIRLAPFQGAFSFGAGLSGTYRGQVNGDAVVEGKVAPERGSTGLTLASSDAGRALSAAGLLKRGQGGALSLRMSPVEGRPGHYDGALNITSIRLRDAPAIAALLNAISVVGLLDQLGGEGIFFSDVEAKFRLSPDRVTVLESSAVGPSMGISMDGFYRLRDKYMDVRGVVSPIYVLNGIGALFSRNREGVFGITYTIKGPSDGPRVRVNPASLLTPGMFRDLFRRPLPEVK